MDTNDDIVDFVSCLSVGTNIYMATWTPSTGLTYAEDSYVVVVE